MRLTESNRGAPAEWLVYDEPTRCPYLPGRVARLPLRLPIRPLRPVELTLRLRQGDRRQGMLLYRPACPTCSACEPIRIDTHEFRPSKTQRRIFRRGEREIETRLARPIVSDERVALYNRHKMERGLNLGDGRIDREAYAEFLVETCADSLELSYWLEGRLLGAAILDRAADALSAVYCYFDPDAGRWSPGTYSILKQLDLCRRWDLRYLYLGLYVGGCETMQYKALFRPHQRRIDGRWRTFGKI